MRWVIATGVAVALIVLAWFWLAGGDRLVQLWAIDGQREANSLMAGALRRLRAGELGAVFALASVCFAYGFFHAVGPGHGKLLIGGYGAARDVGAWWLSLVALASSLAQGATAILLVAAGLWLLGLGRSQMTDLADQWLAPLSFAAIAVIGLWLAIRGGRTLWGLLASEAAVATRGQSHADHRDHHRHHTDTHEHHHHEHGREHICSSCGHAHAPDPRAVANASSLSEVMALIGAVAIRPCTGALFVLILTAQFGFFWAGIIGTLAMALGTASVTIAVAILATSAREGLLGAVTSSATLTRTQPVIELLAGIVILALASSIAISLA